MAATGSVCHFPLYVFENADSIGSALSNYLDFTEYEKKELWSCK
jgi:hypothetical protein